ncbi:uncharacterized protein TrAFT101_008711 [Trichoderma asperellum]|uniref:uncharacterized protein n=1 Tax=Trichoderma asperellum TaxID=101201 RepID=UPI00331D9B50|nr:hypothetical protein TrAFT101_008711 [Trichoderma asperellum]
MMNLRAIDFPGLDVHNSMYFEVRTKLAGAAVNNQNTRIEERFQALETSIANLYRKVNEALLAIFQRLSHANEGAESLRAQCSIPYVNGSLLQGSSGCLWKPTGHHGMQCRRI